MRIIRDLQHDARSTVKHGSYRTAQVMQSDMNSHMVGKIVGCRIVCNIFHSRKIIIIQR